MYTVKQTLTVPHSHWCRAGEHNIEHGVNPCRHPLTYEACPDCAHIIQENENRYKENR